MTRPSCSTPVTRQVQAYDEGGEFAGLTVGAPLAPPTRLNPLGRKAIRDRLGLVTDVRGYTDEMAPAVKNAVQTLLTQDIPALLDAVENPPAGICKLCASIHAVYHDLPDGDDGEDYPT